MLEDKSPSGAGLSVDNPIPVGAKVKIKGGRIEFSGTVRYCRRKHLKYLVGIRRDTTENAQ